MTQARLWTVVGAVAGLTAVACHKDPPKPMQMPPTAVSVLTIKAQTIPAKYQYQGVAQASKHVEVRSNVTGVILKRAFVEGTDVPQGALLYIIDTTIYAALARNAEGTVNDAKARLANTDRNLDRLKGLLAERAVAQKDYDDAEQAEKQAAADVLADQALVDQAHKNLSDCYVRAQIAGRVGLASLELGARVTAATDLLTTIDQVDPIYVSFNPAQEDILTWRREIADKRLVFPAGALRVRAILSDNTYDPEEGTLNFADITVGSQTGTQQLRATFANRAHFLLPNQFVRVEMLDLKRADAILVPQRAVLQGITGAYVYTVGDSNKVGIKPVETGGWDGSQWVIASGLQVGDKVVIDGLQKIFPTAKVNPTPYNPAADTTLKTPQADVPAAPSFPIVRGRP